MAHTWKHAPPQHNVFELANWCPDLAEVTELKHSAYYDGVPALHIAVGRRHQVSFGALVCAFFGPQVFIMMPLPCARSWRRKSTC